MKKIYIALLGLFAIGSTNAQLIDGNAYMVGDYVQVGISTNGHEGAPCQDFVNCTAGEEGLFGFVANPAMDDLLWFGDFFAMGVPESGFGLDYTLLGSTYERSNNAAGALNEIPGSITDFTETTDSVIVTWIGEVDDLELTIVYELKKDELFYTTSMLLNNTGVETFTDVYFYRNLEPDNNQSLGGEFSTENTIVSQSEMANDSVIVKASQYTPYEVHCIFHAYGEDWKGFYGGFSNRDGSQLWNAEGGIEGTEGATQISDVSVGVAYKIETLPPGKAASEWFSFVTAFDDNIVFSEDEPDTDGINEHQIDFNLYPNPVNNDLVNISVSGNFSYEITDIKGSKLMNGLATNQVQLDLNELEKGLYIVTITQNNAIGTQKLIIE